MMVIRMNALTPFDPAESTPFSDTGFSDTGAHPEIAMLQRMHAAGRQSTAEMLQELRRIFPHSPLAVRVRALEALRRR